MRSKRRKDITKEVILKYYIDENQTVEEVAKTLNCGTSLISRRLKEYGIKKCKTAYADSYRDVWTEEKRRNFSINSPMKNPDAVKRAMDTKRERYGDNWAKDICKKSFATYKERTGFDNPFQDVENIKNSVVEKYGVEHVDYVPDIMRKMRESWEKVDRVKLAQKKRETCNERYGVDAPAQSKETQEKMKKTCFDRYGVENIFLSDEHKNNYKSKFSEPNNRFAKILESNNIEYDREFYNCGFSYDFRVDNYLIEIDPYATHNSTWGIYNSNGIDKNYHFRKSKASESSGFVCIHIFDWTDVDYVVSILKGEREFLYKQHESPRCFVYNIKKKEHFIKTDNYSLDKNEVEIYDDGKEIIV